MRQISARCKDDLLSDITAAVSLLASSLIEKIPLPALVGVVFMVVIGTFAWSRRPILNEIPPSDALLLIQASGVRVISDLAIAVAVGMVVSALVFSKLSYLA